MNHQQTKCPNCGVEWNKNWYLWWCGTSPNINKVQPTELCLERRARQRAESEVRTWHLHYRDSRDELQKWKQSWFDLDEKRQKLEAVVVRLKANLRRAIEVAEDSNDSLMDWDENSRCETQKKNRAELNQLKATINQDKK